MGHGLDVTALRDGFHGRVLTPDDAGYEDARRIWNGVIDRRRGVIARCHSTADVVAAVGFARANDLTVAVRGGGHNVAGMASVDGGLVVDLSALNAVRVDGDRRVVRVGGGAVLGDIDAATQAEGLAVPVGVVSETGIAGLTLSGGMGWLGPEVAIAFVLYPVEDAPRLLRDVDHYMAGAPDEVAPIAFFGRVPEADSFPAQAHGKPYLAVLAPYIGGADAGEPVLAPLRELGNPIADLSDRVSFVDAQTLLDEDYPTGRRYYWKSIELTELSPGAIEQLMASADAMPSELSTIDVWFQGGAMSRTPPHATAFGDRSAPILIGVEANWDDAAEDGENIAWARRCVQDLRRFSRGRVYLNFPGFLEEREEMLRAAFGANYDRLVELKTRFDPGNVFRVNQNIAPGAA